MAITHGLVEVHWGDPKSGHRDPGSLSFHNTVLDRKPIVLSSLPPYHTCRDLICVSLYARILHCLELVSECSSLEEYAEKVTLEDLHTHAKAIVARFASPRVVAELRHAREQETLEQRMAGDSQIPPSDSAAPPSQGDTVFENACLFLRDALVMREFMDAIKAGDSGRMILVLKVLALLYRGSGRTKYAYELLFLIHNLEHVWPKALREVVLNNWLVNPTGKANSWVPVDLLQEHMNFWIKVIYKAQGSNASWEWLEMISPCINVLRRLATQINGELGSRQGVKHHSPQLERDISELRRSLSEHAVYEVEKGRVIEGEKTVVPNVVAAGLAQLQGPLLEYNKLFKELKERRRMEPLIGQAVLSRETSPGSLTVPVTEAEENGANEGAQMEEAESGSDSDDGDSDSGEYDGVRIDQLMSLSAEEDVDLEMGLL